jgi:hypothetical protein
MLITHQTRRNSFILGAVFLAFIFLTPMPAGSEEKPDRPALRLTSPKIALLKKASCWNFQLPELEPVTEFGSFFGLKITLKLEGGWNIFDGGNIKTGTEGMYDNGVAYISTLDLSNLRNMKESNRGGLEVGGDLIYAINPRFGIGIGMARTSAWKESHFLYDYSPFPGSFQARPRVNVTALRAGLFYSWPFAEILALSVRGGPALYSAKYTYSLGCSCGFLRNDLVHRSYSQEASAKQVGFEGGLGLELTPNPYVAIFVEVQGRYAKIRDFEGDEAATFYQDGQYRESASSGPVYFIDSAPYPALDIIPAGENVPGSASKATLDFSGVTFLAGLKFRL